MIKFLKSINVLVLVSLIAFFSTVYVHANEEQEHTPITSTHLSTQVSGAYVFSNEEEMGIVLYGKIQGQNSESKLGKISTLYSDEETSLNIEEVQTEEIARGLGVATALYEYVIKSKESYTGKKITHLGGTAKVGTNRDVILKSLIDLLRSKNDFKEPNASLDLQSQFHECCSKIYSKYPELILEAAANSPTAKIGKKLGFEIDPRSIEFSLDQFEDKPHVHINYIQLRN